MSLVLTILLFAAGCSKPAPPPPSGPPSASTGEGSAVKESTGKEWAEADPTDPEAIAIRDVHARAKVAWEAKDYRGFFELSPPESRSQVLHWRLHAATQVAARTGEEETLRQLPELSGAPDPFLPGKLEAPEQREERIRVGWAAVKDPPGAYSALMGWLDKRGQRQKLYDEWFDGEPRVCGLTAHSAKVCLHTKSGPPWKYCDMRKRDGRWFLVIG